MGRAPPPGLTAGAAFPRSLYSRRFNLVTSHRHGVHIRRLIHSTALAAAALAAAFIFIVPARAQADEAARLMAELISGKGPIGSDFTLRDPQGRKRSLADYRGKVVMLYFGYTFCPDVCPTDLLQISRALRSLGPRERQVAPLFVTLDPERDTPRLLRDYARAFHPRIVPLRGSEAETRRLARAFKVAYERVKPSGSQAYVIDHAAFTFILDRQGRYVSFIPPGTPSGRMAVMMEEALGAHRPPFGDTR